MGYKDKKMDLVPFEEDDKIQNILLYGLDRGRKASTYKFGFFKAILDNIFNADDDLRISYDDLAYVFGKVYWNIIVKYDLPQFDHHKTKKSLFNIEIDKIKEKHDVDGVDFDSLRDDIAKEYLDKAKKIMLTNVIGALCGDFESKIYSFDKNENYITLSKKAYLFLIQNKVIFEKLNYYYWIQWMESNLSRVKLEEGNLSIKLDESTKRINLEKFRKSLFGDHDKLCCFYCGKEVTPKTSEVDHFIPWSFVKDDQEWNLVIACRSCNNKKRDHIPDEKYLDKLVERNKKYDLDYKKVEKLYKASLYNGLTKWENK